MGDKKKKAKGGKKNKKKHRTKLRRALDAAFGSSLESEVAELVIGDGLRARKAAETVVADVVRQVELAVPRPERCAAPAEVSIPAIRTLIRLEHDDPRAVMLRQLLVASCDRRTQGRVHGYFAELISQLFTDEARLLRLLASGAEVVRVEAAYPGHEAMYRVRAVHCDQLAVGSAERLLDHLEHLRSMHLLRLTTGSPPGAAIRASSGEVVGHRVHHRAALTTYGRELCALAFSALAEVGSGGAERDATPAPGAEVGELADPRRAGS